MSIKSAIDLTATFTPMANMTAAQAIVQEFTSPSPAENALLNL